MSSQAEITLPNGLYAGRMLHRSAVVRGLTGEDEAILLEAGPATLQCERNTLILTRCVVHLGEALEPTEAVVRELTIGDREALLLWIRQLTFGSVVDAVLTCPHDGCGEKMDLTLRITDLLVEPGLAPPEWEETEVDGSRVRFRRVTGADQEVAARASAPGVEAADVLLQRCVEPQELPEPVRAKLSAILSAADPQAEISLHVTCPGCGRDSAFLFDAGTFLDREVTARSRALFQQVHQLAFHYHWSERQILALSPSRRHRYLDLLAEALSGAPRV